MGRSFALFESSDIYHKNVLQNDLKTPPAEKVKLNNDYLVSWNVDGLEAPTQSDIDALWLNLAIVILKKKSVFVENEKYSIPCILFYSHNI